MSGFFKSLKNQIKEEVVRLAQPQPQPQPQYQQHPQSNQHYPYQYQYQHQYPQPSQYGSAQSQYPPPPQAYPQRSQAAAPQPQYQANPHPQAYQQSTQGTVPQPQYQTSPQYNVPPPPPPPQPQPYLPASSGAREVPPPVGPPPGSFQNTIPQSDPCSGRKILLTRFNQFYVFKHAVFPRKDPAVQDLAFAICEGCFKTHLSRQQIFVSLFEPFQSPDAPSEGGGIDVPICQGYCDFGLPLILDTFYKQCVPQSSIQPLVKVAQEMQDLSECPGNQLWEGGATYRSESIPNCSVCTRCYELYLSPSFAHHFKREVRNAGEQWNCSIGRDPGYVYDILTSTFKSPNPSFASFAHAVNERMKIAPCSGDGKQVQAGSDGKVRMYNLQQANLGACSECYFDYLALSPFSSLFVPSSHNPNSVAMTCDLAAPMSRFIMAQALATKNLTLWKTSYENFRQLPGCAHMTGVPEEDVQTQQAQLGGLATWYSVVNCPRVEICPSCFHCVISPLGTGHLFQPITRELRAGVVRVCSFSIGPGGVNSFDGDDFPTTLQHRGFILRTLLERHSLSKSPTKDYSPFLTLASMLNTTGPPCGANVRGFKKPSGRKYYGRVSQNANEANDCTVTICEECYNSLVKETSLNQWLGNDLTEEVYRNDAPPWGKEGFCQPWSKTSKAVLKQAADANDFTIFARHWNHRIAVREQTLPQIALLRQQFHLQNQVKLNSMLNATMVQAGASISEAAGTTGASYGNSIVGMGYSSYAGVDAAMYRRTANQTAWGNTNHFVQIAELERQWKLVE